MSRSIEVLFLRDVDHGGTADQPGRVAAALAGFVAAARSTLDIAIYDFRLTDPALSDPVVTALREAADRGVAVRIGYDAGKPTKADAATFSMLEADPAPVGTAAWVNDHFSATTVATKAITGGHQLMHDKYLVRDTGTAKAAVWTGSTNFTDAAWTHQENNILTVTDTAMAAAYAEDFAQMWAGGRIAGTGRGAAGTDKPGGHTLGWDFCPGDGQAVNTALAARIAGAKDRLIVASMVLTSPEVLTALAEAVSRGVDLTGIYDSGQMDPIVRRWQDNPHDADLAKAWQSVADHLVDKRSAPYTDTGPHNFMHLKVLVADDTLTTGSYNFSRNAEKNAENQIHLDHPDTVAAYTDYLTAVIKAYRGRNTASEKGARKHKK